MRRKGSFSEEAVAAICSSVAVTAAFIFSWPVCVRADEAGEAVQIVMDISTLTSYVTVIVKGCGSILILYYLFDFAVHMNAAESGGMNRALRGIGAGILFLLAPTIINMLM